MLGQKDAHDSEDHHHEEAAGDEKWAAMDEFHTLMAESFHPYKDTANLAPAKANAAVLPNLLQNGKAHLYLLKSTTMR